VPDRSPFPARGIAQKAGFTIRSGATLTYVGRTLLSAAFEVGFVLAIGAQIQNQSQKRRTGVSAPHSPYRSLVTVTSSWN
jgi:hypothetical protein